MQAKIKPTRDMGGTWRSQVVMRRLSKADKDKGCYLLNFAQWVREALVLSSR